MSYNNGNKNNNQKKGGFGEKHENVKTTQKIVIEGFGGMENAKIEKSRSSIPNNAPRNPISNPSNFGSKNFFCLDIETIPCIKTARDFLNLSNEISDEEVIEKLKAYHLEATNGQNEFFRQLFHRVVAVSFVAGLVLPLKGGKEKYIIKSIKTGGRNGESEEEILRAVFGYLAKHPSRIISFNGRTFDMPVLQYRAMKYGIDAKWIYNDGYYNYNHRYSIEKHCDLLDMFSNFGASARIKMKEVAALFNIPVKSDGIDGSKILPLFKEGRMEEICNYCEIDAIVTYILYLRFMQHSGRISAEGYNIVIENLLSILQSPEAPKHQALFAESFLNVNLGNVFIKTAEEKSSKTEEESVEEESPEHSINIEPEESVAEQL